MKLNKGFITHNDGDETILVATGDVKFSGLVRTNKTAAFIIGCLEKETTEDEIISTMLEKYDASRETIEADVKKTISQLRGIGAIDG